MGGHGMQFVCTIIIAGAIIIAAVFIGGRYNVVAVEGGVLVTDRLTGRVQSCAKAKCQMVETEGDMIERLAKEFGSPR
jgi:hypothetical protein